MHVHEISGLGLIKVGISIPNGYDHYDRNGSITIRKEQENNHFDHIASFSSDKGRWDRANTGKEILDFLVGQFKDENTCPIELLTIAGHGWAYKPERKGWPGIHGTGINSMLFSSFYIHNGFYQNSVSAFWRLYPGSRRVSDLKKLVDSKKVKFEKKCKIQIYSCRISETFSRELSDATGCTVVAAGGACHYPKIGLWKSGASTNEEKKNSEYTGFYSILKFNTCCLFFVLHGA